MVTSLFWKISQKDKYSHNFLTENVFGNAKVGWHDKKSQKLYKNAISAKILTKTAKKAWIWIAGNVFLSIKTVVQDRSVNEFALQQ